MRKLESSLALLLKMLPDWVDFGGRVFWGMSRSSIAWNKRAMGPLLLRLPPLLFNDTGILLIEPHLP